MSNEIEQFIKHEFIKFRSSKPTPTTLNDNLANHAIEMVSTYLFTHLQWIVISNLLRIWIIYSCYFEYP
uniref:Uncharacterized protein n=1 Tax=Lepeophtheirus salmonis TaxID=72036 RepID=A0A0K2UZ33_LEPSM